MAPFSRLLTLLSLLQARRDWPAQVLADRLGISDRTVRRDVDRLRDLGYRIQSVKGPAGGYRLEAGSNLPPLLFVDDQAVVLAVALQTVGLSGTGFEEPAARALATVRQVMPGRLRHRIDALQVATVPEQRGVDEKPVDPAVLVALGSAVRSREVLRFDYAAARSVQAGAPQPLPTPVSVPGGTLPPPRRAEPHHLVARSGRWYLVAWDLDRADWRIFRADRITPLTHTGPRFEPRNLPGGDVRTFVSGRFRGSNGTSLSWPCTGEAVLALPAHDVAPYLADGIVEELPGDRCRVVLGAWSWVALAATLARFDAEIEVVGPPHLAQAFATLARRFTAVASGAAANRLPDLCPEDTTAPAAASPDTTAPTAARA
ncbi:transcriptional regulator [Subtercola sp. Z020]|uniref:helix-turn-helix transcriptional regulator n=1 Tax=Subtercola sp. Z020 TaxID=2080582 RepID=UPI000CE8D564|nr:WYL domain-containing protein [Subtercola sp. Z020]PPF80560.1 transcriptional regulator [Subtercola sp. Z020]